MERISTSNDTYVARRTLLDYQSRYASCFLANLSITEWQNTNLIEEGLRKSDSFPSR